ncbi:unnamed protein product, partial [marine sediment metagenome]
STLEYPVFRNCPNPLFTISILLCIGIYLIRF